MSETVSSYYTFAKYIKKTFNTKAFRISIDGSFGCSGKCIYCENSYYEPPKETISEQIGRMARYYRTRYKAKDFYLYFQKGTGTSAGVEKLKRIYDSGLETMDFLGFIVGTRPDFVNEDIMGLFDSYRDKYDVWIEYGLQSTFDATLGNIRRGHTYGDFLKAADLTERHGIKSTAHLILGLPGEDPEMMVESVRRLSHTPVSGVKFHHLYVLKGTELFNMFTRGEYTALTYEEYADIVIRCIRTLRSDIVVHRILGEDNTSRHVAPVWDRDKRGIIADIKNRMALRGYRQGDLFS